MEMPKRLSIWSIDTIQVPDGYDLKSVPDLTRDNMEALIEEHNKMVDVVEMICQKLGIEESI